MNDRKSPLPGESYLRWRLEDIAFRLESQQGEIRGVREDVAEIKGGVRGTSQKVRWLCDRMTGMRDEVEGHQKKIAVNRTRINEVARGVAGKVDVKVCEKDMGRVSMFLRVFLVMIGGLLVAAAVKMVVGVS